MVVSDSPHLMLTVRSESSMRSRCCSEACWTKSIAVQHARFVRLHFLEDAAQCGGERRPGLGPRRVERDPQEVREVLVLQPSIARVAFRCLH